MRVLGVLVCFSCALLLQLLALLHCNAAQPPLWTGMHADACRSNRGQVAGPLAASPVLLRNVSFPDYGKSHGTPAIDSRGRVFAIFWLQRSGNVLLRRWDVDGSVFDVMLPTLGSDIIEDSNDALLLSDAGVAYVTFSYYSPATCSNCTSLFAVRCDDGATLWSINYHPFIDAMAMHAPPSSSTSALLVLSSQSRQLLMYSTGASLPLFVTHFACTTPPQASCLPPHQSTIPYVIDPLWPFPMMAALPSFKRGTTHLDTTKSRRTGVTDIMHALKKLMAPCYLTLAPLQPDTTLILLVC